MNLRSYSFTDPYLTIGTPRLHPSTGGYCPPPLWGGLSQANSFFLWGFNGFEIPEKAESNDPDHACIRKPGMQMAFDSIFGWLLN
jgi:hypothetical protein